MSLELVPDPPSPSYGIVVDADEQDLLEDYQEDEELSYNQPLVSPALLVLFLVAPSIRLGAFLNHHSLPLSFSVCASVFFLLLSSFAKHIWIMLAGYLGKRSTYAIVFHSLGAGARNNRFVRVIVTVLAITARVSLGATYLQESIKHLSSAAPGLVARLTTTGCLAALLFPFLMSPSFTSKRIICITSLSLTAYTSHWLLVAFNQPDPVPVRQSSPVELEEIYSTFVVLAFQFASSFPLSLYSLNCPSTPITPTTSNAKCRQYSFTAISSISSALSLAMTVPILFLAFGSNRESTAIQLLQALTLISSIPSVILHVTPLPGMSKMVNVLTILTVLCGLSLIQGRLSIFVKNLAMFLSVTGSYLIPAIIHIIQHVVRPPVSIVLPSHFRSHQSLERDELLQRKEITLQRRRLGRRIGWDIGVWALLTPAGSALLLGAGYLLLNSLYTSSN